MQVFIFGAGDAGQSVVRSFSQFYPQGTLGGWFDDKVPNEKILHGIPVHAPILTQIQSLRPLSQDRALIAMPSVDTQYIAKIYRALQKATFSRIDIIPSCSRILENDVHPIDIRPIHPVDIIGRNYIPLNLSGCKQKIQKQGIFITGAGGSLGREIASQLLWMGVRKLVLFGHGEHSIHTTVKTLQYMQEEGISAKTEIIPVIGELQHKEEMACIIKEHTPDSIIHCAAHKHISLMQNNPFSALANNLFGTLWLLQAATEAKVDRLIFISSDKAVYANNTYGLTKMLAEQLVRVFQKKQFSSIILRFGNIFSSRGSLLDVLAHDIPRRKVRLTDKQARRFFLSASEASSLIIKTLVEAETGNTYILEMGEAMSIPKLVEKVIRFYNLRPYQDVDIQYTGLQPGEKAEEQLLHEWEQTQPTNIPRVYGVRSSLPLDEEELMEAIRQLTPLCFYQKSHAQLFRNEDALKKNLKKLFSKVTKLLHV